MYAPPYALRSTSEMRGTLALQYAYSSLAPCRMIPSCSWSTPGRNPGTSTSVTSGMLKASQNWTKRAPFSDALMSSTPAIAAGWLATMPTTWPSSRASAQIRLGAQLGWISKKSRSSTVSSITLRMSYERLGSAGTTSSRASQRRSGSSVASSHGGSSRLLAGSRDSRWRTS